MFGLIHLTADDAGVGVSIGIANHPVQRIGSHDGVRVQQEYVTPTAQFHGLVIGGREAAIVVIGDEPHPRKFILNHGGGAI